jgi:histidinol-phosphate/aromatic aminotransferase/cobyric acid decarboxylase-like protein
LASLAEHDSKRLDELRQQTHTDSAALANLWNSIAAAAAATEQQCREPKPPPSSEAQFFVLVECADEPGQVELIERLQQEGYSCRALLS